MAYSNRTLKVFTVERVYLTKLELAHRQNKICKDSHYRWGKDI